MTTKVEEWKSLIEEERKKRNKESEVDKSELIEIHSDILNKILLTLTISHGKHFLSILNLFFQEELNIYLKVKNQAKEKESLNRGSQCSRRSYSSFKRRREETIYTPEWENVS